MTDRIIFTEEFLKSIDGGLYPEQIKQILDDHEIVNGLLNFINHCDVMIKSYESQLENPKDDDQETFLQSQIDEWQRKKDDLTELIKFKTSNDKLKEMLGQK